MSHKYICAAATFAIGCAVEIYTYKTNPNNSHGIGWGLLATIAILSA